MPITRRQNSEQIRGALLEAAQAIFVEGGARAVTLPAIATRMGCSHGNIIHHFTSIKLLQIELGNYISRQIAGELGKASARAGADYESISDIIGNMLVIFEINRADQLIDLTKITGDDTAVTFLFLALKDLIDGLYDFGIEKSRELTGMVTLHAFSEPLIGLSLEKALGASPNSMRELSKTSIVHELENAIATKATGPR
jgi:AcrR family transcriptional regulator